MEEDQFIMKIEREVGVYQFSCSKNARLGELYDVLSQMRAFVISKIVEENTPKVPPIEEKDG